MFSKEIFSERLKTLRAEKGVRQSELAALIGVRNTAVSMMESGSRSPSVEVLCALADYFDVSIDYLVGRSDDPARH